MEGELAAVVQRVSSTGRRQQTENQDASVYGLVASRGYIVAREFRIKASAWHGKQQPVLDDVLEGIKAGEFTVIAVAALDRLERRGVFALTDWLRAVMRAGGRVESARRGEEWLADTRDEAMWMNRLIWEADRARREAEIKSERIRDGHARKEALGQGWYALPMGWRYETRGKFDSAIVADIPTRQKVREAIEAVSEGGTIQQAGQILGRTAQQAGAIIRNLSYSTGLLMTPAEVKVKPVVTEEVQTRAIAVLDDRVRYRQGRNRQVNADDFAGRIYCHAHKRPLHRTYGPRHKDGSRTRYYRAKWPDGRSCACGSFNADEVDAQTELLMCMPGEPEYEVVVCGADPTEQTRIEAEIVQVARKRPEGWLTTLTDLNARLETLAVGKVARERRLTGRDMGDLWTTMERKEKRRYLERQAEAGNFRVLFWKLPDKSIRSAVVTPNGMIVAPRVRDTTVEEPSACPPVWRSRTVSPTRKSSPSHRHSPSGGRPRTPRGPDWLLPAD
jgi:DNA invertase Pin-like site-specific DNA recombinase